MLGLLASIALSGVSLERGDLKPLREIVVSGRCKAELGFEFVPGPILVLKQPFHKYGLGPVVNELVSGLQAKQRVARLILFKTGRHIAKGDIADVTKVRPEFLIPYSADEGFRAEGDVLGGRVAEVLEMENDVGGVAYDLEAMHVVVRDLAIGQIDIRPQLPVRGIFRHLHLVSSSLGVAISYLQRGVSVSHTLFSGENGLAGVVESPQQPENADEADPEAPFGPIGRIGRTLRRSPLGAKVGIAVLPVIPAWLIIFRGLDWFDGLGCRRNRLRGVGLCLLGCSLIGLSAVLWGWSS